MKDRDVLFHEKWLGLVQPVEGLVFSVPVLADAQITPEVPRELSVAFEAQLVEREGVPLIRDLAEFFRTFLGYDQPGMLVPRAELPDDLSFYAPEGGQEIRPSYALSLGPFDSEAPASAAPPTPKQYWALIWDLAETGQLVELDDPETITGPWRYAPTAKFERLLRQSGTSIGLLANGANLRLLYAPPEEATAHLTFRVEHLQRTDGREILAALELLLHARRAYTAAPAFTLEGLLAESRRRQADVTLELAQQVFEAVEILLSGFEAAAARDCSDRLDWLRPAIEAEDDHFYQGVLSVVLRLVFLLYAEDQSLLRVDHPLYAGHLSLFGLYDRLSQDAGAHPESMHHRFGAYGQLLALFRAVYYGVKHKGLELPPRRGRLFDPNAYPFLEGGQPDWTAAVNDPEARAAVLPPSIDDGTIHAILHRLVVFEGQRLSYRTLDVEQIGSVYESLMGYHVLRLTSPAVRVGKFGVWVETSAVIAMTGTERSRYLKETCGLNPGPVQALEKAAKGDEASLLEALCQQAPGKKNDVLRHRADRGRLVLQPGEERRRTGSHYTPRKLTEKVVRRTLEPLLACLGPERTAEQLLQLKICDPAMGSGAFLVATCRELANEIVAAWTRSGELSAIIEQHTNAHLHARRLVAQKCLYGVDKNPAAVELAKLSLWLITLSQQLPFTFVDHALRHGDSLVGLDFRQIEAFHWSPQSQDDFCQALLREALDQAIELRQQILELANREDPVAQAEKRRLFEFSQQAIDRVRLVADACVGAFFQETKDAAREKERKRRLDLVRNLILLERRSNDEQRSAKDREKDASAAQDARAELTELASEARRKLSPFHWWLEFPEVFFEERPDPLQGGAINGAALMEGVVGNPPFMGGSTISSHLGDGYRDWLLVLHSGAHGNADLSAHFFRRASVLLGEHGSFGLIATNTIAQGDTRTTALKPLLEHGWTLFDATTTLPWPGTAAVTVSLVMGAHGRAAGQVEPRLDGVAVTVINSRLKPRPERTDPLVLDESTSLSFKGAMVYGLGFTLTPEEREALVKKNPKNAERIFPYLGGEEVNTSPTQEFDRYVISFGQMALEEAEGWPDLIRIVREKVKPERDKNKRDVRRKYWWRFGETTPALYAALAPLERCLVTALSGKHRVFAWQPTDRILDQTLIVFPFKDWTQFVLLGSRVHEFWSVELSATIKEDQRYNPSRALTTFPFPSPDPRTVIPELETVGETLYQARAAYMVDTNQGLTKTYNAIKDPSSDDPRILELRRLHEAMDSAVLAAYGWSDVAVPPYCPKSDADRAQVAAFEDEIIDRLYVLNAERAREEKRLGKAKGSVVKAAGETTVSEPKRGRGGKGKKGSGGADGGQGTLF